ncbi:MAG: ATP-binding protein, partial [Planctomycetaceae bacterium]|nr:ATP-binding protein [Planctomycetaceae bacterium]
MSTQSPKQLPYGNADFQKIRNSDFVYIDKTRFIETLEKESNSSQIFIRPRRFGKSLFLSTLTYYYDVNYADEFERLFGDLYIGQHPTPRKNSYAVMNFDFSGLNTANGADEFIFSFCNKIRYYVCQFLDDHKNIFPNAEEMIRQMNEEHPNLGVIERAFSVAKSAKIQVFVIIDEYDHFANDLIAMGTVKGSEFYKSMVKANGIVRDFYETIKSATTFSIVDRTFITGISPVMLDDLTSGYNIATNLTRDLLYNEMLGFTREEVEQLMVETGIDAGQIKVDIEYYYNGYLFNEEGENKVYNPSMMLYFFNQLSKTGKSPKNLIDPNLCMDPSRLKRLIQSDHNRDILIKIIKEGNIVSNVLEKFSIDQLNDDNYFISLLFYMGLLTIKESYLDELRLVIPNYSIQTTYWEYLRNLVKDGSPDITLNEKVLKESIRAMAMEGTIEGLIDYVSKNAFSKLSDFDLQRFDEKYIKVLLLAYLLLNNIYIPMSEYETVPGRADIFLQRNPNFPQVQYEWVLELKYCKTDAKDSEIAQKRKEGLEQLQ